ncbi:hypothetical protein GDI2051 [Gluconacetobacter diazotrophicus PA1 5]|uniref:Uncharacterized protein n=1 Tax=Gluconacetobacter diazotrophicus (strain ATCC 49037 / DSM 5601 / CCUG 37298 / CIP 103539 / LMG 7603 / PAl5) TaxID=272568 RepID=A9HK47_GLUDA|nr:hypothetical protein GDI2051 [Gluconacetobacter diazotrophicus PA1 5]
MIDRNRQNPACVTPGRKFKKNSLFPKDWQSPEESAADP